MNTPSFEVEEGGCRQRPPSILGFCGSCSSIAVLTTSLNAFLQLIYSVISDKFSEFNLHFNLIIAS